MNTIGYLLSIRADAAPSQDAPMLPLRLPSIRRAVGYIAVTGIGLAIGTVLGFIAALMSGLIMLC